VRGVREEASLVIEGGAELGVEFADLNRAFHDTPGQPEHGKQKGECEGSVLRVNGDQRSVGEQPYLARPLSPNHLSTIMTPTSVPGGPWP